MPSVMLRRSESGKLLFYVAKKDLEATVETVEKDNVNEWGGQVVLADGSSWYINPISPPPDFPATLRFKRA